VAYHSFFFPSLAPAQSLDKPTATIDEDITAFAFAPDGRIVYSVRRMFRTKSTTCNATNIWIQDTGGRRKRISRANILPLQDQSLRWTTTAPATKT